MARCRLPGAGCPLPSPHDWARLFIEHLRALGAGVRFAFGNFRFFFDALLPLFGLRFTQTNRSSFAPKCLAMEWAGEEWVDRQGVGCGADCGLSANAFIMGPINNKHTAHSFGIQKLNELKLRAPHIIWSRGGFLPDFSWARHCHYYCYCLIMSAI